MPVHPYGGIAAAVFITSVTACVASAFQDVGPALAQAIPRPIRDRKAAPDFTLPGSAGRPVKLSDLRGKVVLLNYWATWCGPCKIEIPWLIEFYRTYKNRDFVILGISLDKDGWKSVKPYIDEKMINYEILIGDEDVAKAYGGLQSLPATFIIDKAGRVAYTHIGVVSQSKYQSEIEDLLDPHP